MKKWIAFQLTERGEAVLEENPTIIEKHLKKIVSSEIFLPLYFNKTKTFENKIFLFRGYVFVEYNEKEVRAYSKLINSLYFIGPVAIGKKLQFVDNEEIRRLKEHLVKLTKPSVKLGDLVQVMDGKYKNLQATVIEYYPKEKEADLSISLKCMSIIVTRIPAICLKNISNPPQTRDKKTIPEKITNLLKKHKNGLSVKELQKKLNLSSKKKKKLGVYLQKSLRLNLIQENISNNKKYYTAK